MLEVDATEFQWLEQQGVLKWAEARWRSSRRHVCLMLLGVTKGSRLRTATCLFCSILEGRSSFSPSGKLKTKTIPQYPAPDFMPMQLTKPAAPCIYPFLACLTVQVSPVQEWTNRLAFPPSIMQR